MPRDVAIEILNKTFNEWYQQLILDGLVEGYTVPVVEWVFTEANDNAA